MPNAKPIKKLPPIKYLSECFTYNRRTGALRWRRRPREHFADDSYWKRWNKRYAGTVAGYLNKRIGYWVVCLSSVPFFDRARVSKNIYYVHRIIFKLMTGKEPPATLDHIEGNKVDHRWIKLRTATQQNQRWNSRGWANSVSGKKGVSLDRRRGRWRARIKINDVEQFLGYFDTIEDAARAYKVAARKLHGEFYREV
jgi:HNH endonuclease